MIYLISFPRSGNSWLRYCIEHILKIPTIDINPDFKNRSISECYECKEKIRGKNKIIKSHKFIATENDKLIFILRNYKDCIESHKQRSASGPVDKFLNEYFSLLKQYDDFSGDKTIIYYEDIIDENKLPDIMKNLSQFLESDCDIDDFVKNYEKHKQESKNGYQTKFAGHRNKNITVNINISTKLKNKHKKLIEKYMEKYI